MTTASREIEEPPQPGHVRSLSVVTALVIGSLWLVPLFSSLWVDELGAWWVVKDGLGETVSRAFTFQGQSPLYYLIVWAARSVSGNSEAVLRLPSLLAAAVSAILLYRLADTLIDRETARISVLVFAASHVVAFEASEARPYSLATLSVIGSTYALVRWLDDGRRWLLAIVYALLAVAVMWLHYLFALALVPQAIYAVVRIRRNETEVTGRRLIAVAAIVTGGVVPLAIQIASLWDRRSSLSIPNASSAEGFALALVPSVLVASVILGSLVARTQGPVWFARPTARSSTLALLGSWVVFPVMALFLVSALTPYSFTWPRYLVSAAPGAALLGGWAIASLEPAAVRRIVAVVLAILSVLAYGGRLKNGEDWRAAAAFERQQADANTIVLLHPALVESAQLDWTSDPEKVSYLLAVKSYYPMDGHVLPMPYVLDDAARGYLEGLVTDEIAGADRFLLVTAFPQVPFREWLDGRLAPEEYTSRVIGNFGVIEVIEFARSP